jgi:hypothetical protein
MLANTQKKTQAGHMFLQLCGREEIELNGEVSKLHQLGFADRRIVLCSPQYHAFQPI